GSQDFPSTFYGRESYEFKKNSGEDYKEVKTNFETRLKNIYFGRHFWEIQYTHTQQRYTIDIDSPLLKTELEKWGYSSQQQSLQLGLGYDSRNSKIRSTEGHLLNLFYKQTALDSEKLKQNFGLFGFDYKLYLSIDADHSLAIQLASSQQEHKDLPFYALAGLGGNQILRGYYGNQFRDYALGFSQIEWRTLWKESWGYRCFLGYGMHATKISQLELSQAKIAGGLGIDYFLDQKTKNNLRFDIGYSPGQVGIYFLYGNAF
ncbi:MAG: BamA/TamA family outer membrane protein, partial [Proteobacteria bacterium]|nr:BamA/TamA family outer membrane protein [Pseudomonadota bacterium]